VGVFPEGKTTRGDAIGTFHARIFQPAVLAGVPAQPVALKYGLRGDAQTIVAFGEKENFLQNFLRLLGEPGRIAEVHFLEPVASSDDGRRRMAETCRERIIAAMAG
jgi:1-acyl-sn-glycerol-3-phosphate acyltransferase